MHFVFSHSHDSSFILKSFLLKPEKVWRKTIRIFILKSAKQEWKFCQVDWLHVRIIVKISCDELRPESKAMATKGRIMAEWWRSHSIPITMKIESKYEEWNFNVPWKLKAVQYENGRFGLSSPRKDIQNSVSFFFKFMNHQLRMLPIASWSFYWPA